MNCLAFVSTLRVSMVGIAALAVPSAALAQSDQPPPRIVVTGVGSARTPPDTATLSLHVRGEGATADDATRALVAKRDAIAGGIASLAGATPMETSTLSVIEARDKDCQNDYQARGRLAQGDCAVRGYIAEIDAIVRLRPIAQAGTATGLVARLGGSDVRLSGFTLSDDSIARRKATAAALADARAQAEAIAAGSGVHILRLQSVGDTVGHFEPAEIVVTAERLAPPPPPPPPAPVAVSLTPQPVETTARLSVVYLIAP